MLDFDLAHLYEVGTKVLNQAVKRNLNRFPADFMFQLTDNEWKLLQQEDMRSQVVTASIQKRNKQALPYVFTEHGVAMLASVLRSEKAVAMSILVVRAFISLRYISRQYEELAEKLAQLEGSNHKRFKEIYEALQYLVEDKQKADDFSNRRRIGFRNT